MPADATNPPAAEAVAYAETVIGDRYHWSLSAGCIIGDGPKYCFSIWSPDPPPEPGPYLPLAMHEHDDPMPAVIAALRELDLIPERTN